MAQSLPAPNEQERRSKQTVLECATIWIVPGGVAGKSNHQIETEEVFYA
jgi:hypothetical protein